MLNRSDTHRKAARALSSERLVYRRENLEILSLTLAFWRRTLLPRTPRRVVSLDELIQGFETYTDYRIHGRGPLGRTLVRSLDSAYRVASRRIGSVRQSAGFARRCERQALAEYRRRALGGPDHETVLFTLMFVTDEYQGPHAEIVRSMIRRYRIAGPSGTALLAAPRWVHELMLVLWPIVSRGQKDRKRTREAILAAATHAGMSLAHTADGVDLDALVLLWDDDPLQLYFGLEDVLPALARL